MGRLFELASVPVAYAMPSWYDAHVPAGADEPHLIPYGSHRQQHCVLWEPHEVRHEACVLYFHGGAYVFGEAESLADVARCYLSQGYRFCSVGFRAVPAHRFPAQVADAFVGAKAALSWLESHGRPAQRIVVGGTSAGGQLAALVAYASDLQRAFGFPVGRICACVSVAGVADAADLLLHPLPCHLLWHLVVALPTHGRSRGARARAVARYSPTDIVSRSTQLPQVPLFVVHGRSDALSPYASQLKLVAALRAALGDKMVCLHTLEGRRWQHMVTTVTLHKSAVEDSEALGALFSWLERVPAEDTSRRNS